MPRMFFLVYFSMSTGNEHMAASNWQRAFLEQFTVLIRPWREASGEQITIQRLRFGGQMNSQRPFWRPMCLKFNPGRVDGAICRAGPAMEGGFWVGKVTS